jgi:L-lactate dehydrogenase
MRKVGIVGIGHVGATVAHLIVSQGLADELVLIDKKPEKVASEALDFSDAASLLDKHIDVHVGDYPDLADADVVISALGHIHLIKPDGDRFGELKANLPMAKQVGADLKAVGFNGVLLAISNPVDVITGYLPASYRLAKCTSYWGQGLTLTQRDSSASLAKR